MLFVKLVDLSQFARAGGARRGGRMLWRALRIKNRKLINPGNRAMGCAGFFCEVLATDICNRVLLQRNRGIAALLRAIVHQSVFANIQISGAGPAPPLVWTPQRNVVLK